MLGSHWTELRREAAKSPSLERLRVGREKRGGDYSDEPAGSPEAGAGLWKADFRPAWGERRGFLEQFVSWIQRTEAGFWLPCPEHPAQSRQGCHRKWKWKRKSLSPVQLINTHHYIQGSLNKICSWFLFRNLGSQKAFKILKENLSTKDSTSS